MRNTILLLLIILINCSLLTAQQEYEPSTKNPYGLPNPNAPVEIKDYQPMIGICDCKSVSRNSDQTWADSVDMTWEFKYIMNGNGVQDQTIKTDGKHSGSIRQYNVDSSKWYVHYYSSAGVTSTLSSWQGGKIGDDMILYKEQKAPNGMDGFYKITFKDITKDGFNWLGEWVTLDESFKYPTWKIYCVKRKSEE